MVDWNHQVLQSLGEFDMPVAPTMPSVDGIDTDHRPLVTISVSAGQEDKAYPADAWRQVAQSLLEAGVRVVFLGGPTDGAIKLQGTEDKVAKLPLDKKIGRAHV